MVDIVIKRNLGGLWKFKLLLEAIHPNVDDVIILSSPLHKTSSIEFKLSNRKKKNAAFSAKFSMESDSEFSVTPKSGILLPYGDGE